MASARILKLGIAALATLLVVSCADAGNPLQPAQQPLLAKGAVGAAHSFAPVTGNRRARKTKVDAVVSAESGGEISAAGVTLTIPGGALRTSRRIKLTVPQGDYLEAQFAPHGLTFETPADLCFDAEGLDGEELTDLIAIYMGPHGVDSNGRISQVLETIEVSRVGEEICVKIGHFSGYIVASGRSSRR